MRSRPPSKSVRWLLVSAVLFGMSLTLGCRRAPKQTESPTPLPDTWQFDSDDPTYPELPPPASNPQAIPPMPGAAAMRPYDAHEDFGGFTTTPATQLVAGSELLPDFDAELSSPRETLPDAESLLPESGASEFVYQNTLELPPLSSLDAEAPRLPGVDPSSIDALHSDDAVPLALALRTPSEAPVSLDPLQFVIDLEQDSLESAADRVSSVSSEPVAPHLTETAELPRIVATPETSRGRVSSVAEWPQSGVPHGMIISPGPTTEKWAAPPIALDVIRSRVQPPRRLSERNLDWETGRTE